MPGLLLNDVFTDKYVVIFIKSRPRFVIRPTFPANKAIICIFVFIECDPNLVEMTVISDFKGFYKLTPGQQISQSQFLMLPCT